VEVEPHELVETVAAQAARGDGWVKIVGDWIDRDEGDLRPCWPREELAAAVARAHELGARVTTHVFGEDAVLEVLAAGVDCIEHATGMTDDAVAQLAQREVPVVPTLINIDNFPAIAAAASRFPAYAEHMLRLHSAARDRVAAAYEAGVPLFAGTDAGGALAHGRIADEVEALHDAGLPAVEALAAASWRARSWLGLPEPFVDGAPADFVVFDTDPRADLGVLRAPRRVVLRGVVVG
jgi:imidazolonepropionase-like amidohydrolase